MGLEDELNEILADASETASEEKLTQIRGHMIETARFVERQVKFLEHEGVSEEIAHTLVLMWYTQGHLPPEL